MVRASGLMAFSHRVHAQETDSVTERVHEIATCSLGWQDLPSDETITVTVRFSPSHLEHVTVSYLDETWSLAVIDSVQGVVAIDDSSGDVPDARASRAIRGALDVTGVRLQRP